MFRIVEDTVTQYFVEYLRNQGIVADFKRSISLPGGRRGEPDIVVSNYGIFYGEAEWEDTILKGFAQAHDYANALDASGSFVIIYPRNLVEEATQLRLGKILPEKILSKYRYRVAFLKKEVPTDVRTLALDKIPSWFREHIHERKIISPDISAILPLLKRCVDILTVELGEPSQHPKLFTNIIGGKLEAKDKIEAAKNAAGYLLLDQIIFYRVLSAFKGFPEINPDSLSSPQELNEYFSKVLEENYSPIFSFGVASEFSKKSLPTFKNVIKFIYSLTPEHLDRDILGKLFHKLIPIDIRKPLGAYYTLIEAANLLATLAIDGHDEKVLDPACGSGTLLAASYRRKKQLLEMAKVKFDREIHRRFLEKEITGIDIMPFATHLSVVHLALQAPVYQTEEVRIAIEDSTTLKPGIQISPLSRVLPLAKRQRTLDELCVREDEMVEAGAIKINGLPGKKIRLDKVNVVIMNPPFTRQETIADFSSEYKNKLASRFLNKKELIDRRMSYCSYFLMLADEFLKQRGKLAAVLPCTVLAKEVDQGIRSLLYNGYSIRYVVAREDALNFSDSTNLREILLVAQKLREPSNSVMYVLLKKLDSELYSKIKHHENLLKNGEFVDDKEIRIYKVSQESLDPENLFEPISVSDVKILKFWEEVSKNNKLLRAREIGVNLQEGVRSRQGGNFPETALLDKKIEGITSRDLWIIKEAKKDSVTARNRYTRDSVELPINALIPCARTATGRKQMDMSDLTEFVVSRKFKNHKGFCSISGIKESSLSNKWKEYLENRTSYLGIIETLHVEAPGTYFFAYYTKTPRVFGSSFWNVTNINELEARILTIWLNSTINIAQLFIKRVPTGWFKVRGYTFDKLLLLSQKKLSKKEISTINDVFQEVRQKSFPSLWKQFARNVASGTLTPEWKRMLSEIFLNFDKHLGQGFEPRRKIDNVILEILGYNEDDRKEILEWLYPALLKEVYILKKMNKVDVSS